MEYQLCKCPEEFWCESLTASAPDILGAKGVNVELSSSPKMYEVHSCTVWPVGISTHIYWVERCRRGGPEQPSAGKLFSLSSRWELTCPLEL
jgi:hypothetical protein